MTKVCVLGSTGSIGANTLDVISRHSDKYVVHALTANTQVDLLVAQCLIHRPAFAVVADDKKYSALKDALLNAGLETIPSCGAQGLVDVATDPDASHVVAAIVGAAGLIPALAAVRSGKTVLLANKEALVVSGGIFIHAAAESGATLLPVDSEHNAIFQCLPTTTRTCLADVGVRKLILTASGGPFLDWPAEKIIKATPAQACAHPNWDMGKKISVDSATMMNKGLEVIEARWLFSANAEEIEVLIHPQSIVHSLVEYIDGSVLAQLGVPDMRTPIANALAWPQRIESGVAPLNLAKAGELTFDSPDLTQFPCLGLAYDALTEGDAAPCVLNAANEVAVSAFLHQEISFTDIASVNSETLSKTQNASAQTLDAILETDRCARRMAAAVIQSLA